MTIKRKSSRASGNEKSPAKLNGVNPQAWLTDVLGRIADHKITRLEELMPWRYAHPAPHVGNAFVSGPSGVAKWRSD
jgi:hypothetical protein